MEAAVVAPAAAVVAAEPELPVVAPACRRDQCGRGHQKAGLCALRCTFPSSWMVPAGGRVDGPSVCSL